MVSDFMCGNCMKCLIIFLNVLAMLASFAMINIGAIVIWNRELVKSVVGPILNNLATGAVPLTERQVSDIAGEFHNLIGVLGWAPFIFGFFIFAASVLALVGICRPSTDVLLAYVALTGLLIVIPLLIMIIYLSDRPSMMTHADNFLLRHMAAYESINSSTTSSILMGVFMAAFQCCGYNNGSDFNTTGWRFTGMENLNGRGFNLTHPLPCCKPGDGTTSTTGIPPGGGGGIPPVIPIGGLPCPLNFTANNSYIEVGCRKILTQQLVFLTDIVAFTSLIPLCFNIMLLIVTVVIIVNYRQVLVP